MVRAHAVGADLSASHLFSFFSNSTITQNGTTALERVETLSAPPPLLARPSAPRSLLERQANSFSLTLEQQQIDAMGHSFAESVSDGSALAFVLGAGALARNVRLGFTVGEGVFASLANMSARARVASGALGALALVGCGEEGTHTGGVRWPIPDAGQVDVGVVDGGGDARNLTQLPEVIRISLNENNREFDESSEQGIINGDGNFVIYKNLFDIYVRNVLQNKTEKVTVTIDNKPIQFSPTFPSINFDGSLVSFISPDLNYAYNTGDINNYKIYLRDRKKQKTTMIAHGVLWDLVQDFLNVPRMSSDGAFMVFNSNVNPMNRNTVNYGLFVYSNGQKTTNQITDFGNYPELEFGQDAHISNDGRFIAFSINSNNLPNYSQVNQDNIFIFDRSNNSYNRVSRGINGAVANGSSYVNAISPDGRYILFTSDASNLVPNDKNTTSDVFLYDHFNGNLQRVSINSNVLEANAPSIGTSISRDARYVVFHSAADNIVPNDTNGVSDVFVRDRVLARTVRVSVGPNGLQANGASDFGSIDALGRRITYHSEANNLVEDDTNNVRDVFNVGLDYFFK